eukprot:scaffold1505_cov118-Cylindrotheca_fusiformis.AAC.3
MEDIKQQNVALERALLERPQTEDDDNSYDKSYDEETIIEDDEETVEEEELEEEEEEEEEELVEDDEEEDDEYELGDDDDDDDDDESVQSNASSMWNGDLSAPIIINPADIPIDERSLALPLIIVSETDEDLEQSFNFPSPKPPRFLTAAELEAYQMALQRDTEPQSDNPWTNSFKAGELKRAPIKKRLILDDFSDPSNDTTATTVTTINSHTTTGGSQEGGITEYASPPSLRASTKSFSALDLRDSPSFSSSEEHAKSMSCLDHVSPHQSRRCSRHHHQRHSSSGRFSNGSPLCLNKRHSGSVEGLMTKDTSIRPAGMPMVPDIARSPEP